jgi:hypothetical protein
MPIRSRTSEDSSFSTLPGLSELCLLEASTFSEHPLAQLENGPFRVDQTS